MLSGGSAVKAKVGRMITSVVDTVRAPQLVAAPEHGPTASPAVRNSRDEVDTTSWLFQLSTLTVSFVLFIAVVMVAWNFTLTSALLRVNDACDIITPTQPANRMYILAVCCYDIARALLLVVIILTVLYFGSQMLDILKEYLPHRLTALIRLVGCISCTDYTFRAVEPRSTLKLHTSVLLLSVVISIAVVLFYISDSDLYSMDIMRRKLVYAIVIVPVFAITVYCVYLVRVNLNVLLLS